jgi:hypothetical protein
VDSGRAKKIAGWILSIVLAFAFITTGGAKLLGQKMMVQEFDQVH